MAIRIAQASSSEDFTKYGNPGNQRRTGVTAAKPQGNLDGELNVITFKDPWECVYRAIDPEVAEKIAQFMYESVANANVGYSWSGNTQLFDAMKSKGTTNPKDVTTKVNVDCATDVGGAIYFAGIKDDRLRALVTWKMDEVLMSTNAFSKLTSKELVEHGKGLRRGDILWRTGHTGVVLDTDTSNIRIVLDNTGLEFEDEKGNVTGKYPANINMNKLFYFQKFTFNNISISSGTPGTRATQISRAIGKAGYKPFEPRLASVSNSALVDVRPFFGGGEENKLYVNYYRASSGSGKVDCSVVVIYIRSDVVFS